VGGVLEPLELEAVVDACACIDRGRHCVSHVSSRRLPWRTGPTVVLERGLDVDHHPKHQSRLHGSPLRAQHHHELDDRREAKTAANDHVKQQQRDQLEESVRQHSQHR